MGKKEKVAVRAVLDTNVLVSALLFRGPTSRLVSLWKAGAIIPLISREIAAEYLAVLAYPKFKLTESEINSLWMEEILPYVEVIETEEPETPWNCPDPEDEKFLTCAISGRADVLITGDPHLLAFKKIHHTRILPPADFISRL